MKAMPLYAFAYERIESLAVVMNSLPRLGLCLAVRVERDLDGTGEAYSRRSLDVRCYGRWYLVGNT